MRALIVLLLVIIGQPLAALELLGGPGEPAPQRSLDVSLLVFNPGIAEDTAQNRQAGIFPEIRNAEARYLPYALRRTLVDSNQWGAVRVIPEPDKSAELLVSGRILVSDGATLSIAVEAHDATGYRWLAKTYTGTAAEIAYEAAQRRARRPFQDVYNEVANDLLQLRRAFSESQLRAIRNVAQLRYATSLAPEAFGSYLGVTADGLQLALRLPANNDPMMQRILRIREQEFSFIDTADEQFATLYPEMTPVYDLWRQFQREQLLYREVREDRLLERDKPAAGTYQAYKQSYNNYRWAKLQAQEMKLLAKGFNNEIAPTTMDIEGTVVNLSGSLDERYREWRRILRQIYKLETGNLPPNLVD